MRALVETAALAGQRGAYRLIRPVEQLTIPPTVQAILAARIDRLPPEAKRLLQAASVIGTDVSMPMERLFVDRLGEHVERLAHHALRGGMRVGALSQAVELGERPSGLLGAVAHSGIITLAKLCGTSAVAAKCTQRW